MSEWKEYKFSDLAYFVSEKINTNILSIEKYISTDNMLPNLGGVSIAEKLSTNNKCNAFLENDILFSNIRTYFKKVWLANFEGGCSADVLVIRTKDKNIALNEYLYLIISSDNFIQYTVASSKGTKMPRGDKSAILDYRFFIPNIEIQKKIVEQYFSLDQKITLNTQINQTLEQIAQATFKSWFIEFDPVHAKANALANGETEAKVIRATMEALTGKTSQELDRLQTENPTAYEQFHTLAQAFPSEFEDVEEYGKVPKGWGVKKIDEVIKRLPVGKKYSQKTVLEKGNVPVLDQGKSGIIGYHNEQSGLNASVDNPVIVFANHTCYMRLITYPFSAIQNIFAFVGKECNIHWLYLATLGKQEFTEYKGHFPDFLIKEIIIPNIELTNLFGDYVKNSFSKIAVNEKENEYLAGIRDLLLPKLLNGEIER